MIYVYEDPIEFIRTRAKQVDEGQYRLVLLFLGTQFNEEFLKDVEALAPDLDSLTDAHAMAILFTPPPPNFRQNGMNLGFGACKALGRSYHWSEWDDFLRTMTTGTYAVARSLGIAFKDLPCVVFLDPDESVPEYAVWKLRDTPFRTLYGDLRSALDRWYRENSEVIDEIELLSTIKKFPWDKVPSNQPEMAQFKAFVNDTVVPRLLVAAGGSGVSEKVKERIEHLADQARNPDFVRPALRASPSPLHVDGRVWAADSFTREFFEFVHAEAGRH